MWLHWIALIGGLLAILWGANSLTDGAAAIAKRFRISDLIIGLTIVALGTSLPEFVISILAAIQGSAGIAIGNVVGSNLFNTLVIVGCVALITPIPVGKGTLYKEIPFSLLAAIVLLICGNAHLLNGTALPNVIQRTDGLLLLCFCLIFIAYTIASAYRGKEAKKGESEGETALKKEMNVNDHPRSEGFAVKEIGTGKSTFLIIAGLIALIGGGEFFVQGASALARAWGVSEGVIGLTLVAGGTSLPELATSVVAAIKKNTGMAIGNVIGSNLFNIFLVLGGSAAISPIPLGDINNFDLLTLVGSSLLLWIFGYFYKTRIITRLEGALLVVAYMTYLSVLLYQI